MSTISTCRYLLLKLEVIWLKIIFFWYFSRKYCENVSMKPLSTADFGKVMKQVYPGVRPRRLGTRGNSRYCYSGMRNTCKLPTPVLPRLGLQNNSENERSSDGECGDSNRLKKIFVVWCLLINNGNFHWINP